MERSECQASSVSPYLMYYCPTLIISMIDPLVAIKRHEENVGIGNLYCSRVKKAELR